MIKHGDIEKSRPKQHSPGMEKSITNKVNDIEGTSPKKLNAITPEMRANGSNYNQGERPKKTRNEQMNNRSSVSQPHVYQT
jgi:hypothetical protein